MRIRTRNSIASPVLELNRKRLTSTLKSRGRSYAVSGLSMVDRVVPNSITGWGLKKALNIQLAPHRERASLGVRPAKFRDDAKGALCLTVDWDLPFQKADQRTVPHSKTSQVSTATANLLRLSGAYDFPITVAVCAEHAQKVPGVLDLISSSNEYCEIASHTFSHMDMSAHTLSREVTEKDLRKNAEVLSTTPRSFVFPWNREGQKDLLRELGFICYRGGARDVLGYPNWNDGIWDIPKSYYLKGAEAYHVRTIARRLVDLTIRHGCLLHIWTHPWNLQTNGDSDDFAYRSLNQFFRYAAGKREEGLLWIATMQQIANYCEAFRNTRVSETTQSKGELSVVAECRVDSPPYDSIPEVTLKASLPVRASTVQIISNGIPTNLFSASCRKFKSVHFAETFETPRKQIRIRWS